MRGVVNRVRGLSRLLKGAMVLVAMVTGLGAEGAWGQVLTGELRPKAFSVVDNNGVDLADRSLNLSQSIAIGDPANGGLSYSVDYSSTDSQWGFYRSVRAYVLLDRIINPETGTEEFNWALHVGGKTEAVSNGFNTGGAGELYGELGSRVDIANRADTGEAYVASAQLSDGTQLTFDGVPLSVSSTGTLFRVVSATKPNGDRTDYHYPANTIWPRSITNSHGYQVRFELVQPVTSAALPQSVTLFNMAIDACDPDAASCPAFSRTWPKLTFEYQASRVSAIVQANGDRTTYIYGSSSKRVEQVSGPGARSATYTYQDCGMPPPGWPAPYGNCDAGAESLGGYRLTSVSSGGRTWSYAWDPSLVQSGKREYGTRVTSAAGSIGYNLGVALWDRLGTSDIYWPAARVLAVTDELGRKTQVEYEGLLNPRTTKVTYPEANGVEYVYDQRSNLTRIRTFAKPGGPADQVVTIQYGEAGTTQACIQPVYCNKPILIRDARNYVTRNTWNASTGVLEATETSLQGPDANLSCALGANLCPKTVYGYTSVNAYFKNSAGQLAAGPAILNLSLVSLCDTATTCAEGTQIVTALDYGAAGVANNLLVRSQSIGMPGQMVTTSFAYNEVGDRTTADGPRTDVADVTRYEWDLLRRPTLEIHADNSATRTAYNAEGYVESVAKGTVSGSAFTAVETTSYLYDGGGNQKRITTPAGVTQISYDGANRKLCTAVRMTSGAVLDDACALAVPLATAAEPDRITRTVYDAAGQVLQVREAVATALERAGVTYSYTLNGKQEYVIDANGNRTKWEYDGFDRLAKWTFPSTSRPTAYNPSTQANALATAGALNGADYETYGYDAGGNRTSLTKRDGRTITYAYDALNRMALKDVPVGDDVYYGYDLRGLQLYARFGSSTGAGLTNTYDALGRVKTASNNLDGTARTLSYDYNPAGNRTELKFPDAVTFTYEYDNVGRMTAIKEGAATKIVGLSYDALGRRSGLSEGVATTYGYDAAGRLTSLSHNLASVAFDVTFSVNSYNLASQATQVSVDTSAYAWRAVSNSNRAYAANGLNQYATVGGAGLTYDPNGNLTYDSGTTYGYDVENRLTSATGAVSASLAYDPLGRLSRTVGAETTRFLYDGPALVAEYDGSGVLRRRYVHGPGVDEPLIWYEGANLANRRLIRSDRQGSIVAVADSGGNSVVVNTYDEYGVPAAGNQGRFQYTGQAWIPELGLYHYKARIYSPTLGRFLQTDPVGYKDDFNLYAYVGNDPVNGTDPTGTEDLRGVYRDTYKNGYAGMPEDMAYLEGRYPVGFGAYTFAYGTLATAPLFDWAAMGISKLASSVWALGPATRGLEIEASVIKSMNGAEKLPVNFPTIDALRAGTAISVKSIDLSLPTYQSASRLAGTLDRYVAQLAKFRQATLSGRTVAEGVDFTSRELVVGVPKGGMSPTQAEVFSKAAERAKALDVNLTVREFR